MEKCQKSWKPECWRKKSSLSKGCRQISHWRGREESGGGVTLKDYGCWSRLKTKEHEDKRTCYTPTQVSCITYCLTTGSEHKAQRIRGMKGESRNAQRVAKAFSLLVGFFFLFGCFVVWEFWGFCFGLGFF